jgi:hypothetical protein
MTSTLDPEDWSSRFASLILLAIIYSLAPTPTEISWLKALGMFQVDLIFP